MWENGSLAVAETDQAFGEKVQQATLALSAGGYVVFGTQDWHPAGYRVTVIENLCKGVAADTTAAGIEIKNSIRRRTKDVS